MTEIHPTAIVAESVELGDYRSQLNLRQSLEKLDKSNWGEPASISINFLKSDTKKGFLFKALQITKFLD